MSRKEEVDTSDWKDNYIPTEIETTNLIEPEPMKGEFKRACWKTHKKVGMKMKIGKMVNDHRPKNESVQSKRRLLLV